MRFEPGSTIEVREVLHGRAWLDFPETVVHDDGKVLATLLVDGAPFTFHDHPWGPHPWAHLDGWHGPTVLKLRRSEDWCSVWKFLDGDALRFWYVNFETPVLRGDDGIAVNDLQLDVVIEPDGSWRWKDVEHLGPCLASGRITPDELRHVLDSAAEVADLLERDDRWWSTWDGWTPSSATMAR